VFVFEPAVLIEIDGQTVKRIADMRLALWDRKPGDRVRVSVRRMRHFGAVTALNFEVELAAPGKPAAKS
jgi:S1-C subfamily serine protease